VYGGAGGDVRDECDLCMPASMVDVVYGADVLDVVGVAEERCTRDHRVTKVVRCFAFREECSTAMTRATEGSSEGGGGTRNGEERGDDMQKGKEGQRGVARYVKVLCNIWIMACSPHVHPH
jgi:hypothetical protein